MVEPVTPFRFVLALCEGPRSEKVDVPMKAVNAMTDEESICIVVVGVKFAEVVEDPE